MCQCQFLHPQTPQNAFFLLDFSDGGLSVPFAAVLPKTPGALPEGTVEGTGVHPAAAAKPPGQRRRKPGRRKTKLPGHWVPKGPTTGPQGPQPPKDLEPVKIPRKRGPKPGSKVRAFTPSISAVQT